MKVLKRNSQYIMSWQYLFLLLTLLVSIFFAPNNSFSITNNWVPMGPNGGTIFALERSPDNPDVLFAGTYFGGLYKSINGGVSWEHVDSPMAGYAIFSIALPPNAKNIIYVGTFEGGIFKSTDNGATWSEKNVGLTERTVQSIAVDPFNSSNIVAATSAGVFLSNNGGDSWIASNTGLTTQMINFLIYSPAQPDLCFLGTLNEGVYRSLDGGRTWESYSLGMGDGSVMSLNYDRSINPKLYATVDNKVFKLAASSDTWIDLTYNLPAAPVNQLVFHPIDNIMYAVSEAGVYIGGPVESFNSWTEWNDFPSRLMVIDRNGILIHIATLHARLILTYDDGQTWKEADQGLQNLYIGALDNVSAYDQSVIYAGTDKGIIYTSEYFNPGGPLPWGNSFQGHGLFKILPHPLEPNTLFVGTERAGIWKSNDWGANWAQTSKGLLPTEIFAIDQSSLSPHTLYAGTNWGLHISRDNGQTWELATQAPIPTHVLSIATDPFRPGIALFGGAWGQAYLTIDDGKTIVPRSKGLPPNDNIRTLRTKSWSRFFAVTSGGRLFSTDNDGLDWVPSDSEILDPVLSVDVDHDLPWVVYAGTAGGGVYKSSTNGFYWSQMNSGLEIPYVFSLLVDQQNPQTIYAGTVGKIYRSTDGAESWIEISSEFPSDGHISNLVQDKTDLATIYASIENYGIYKTENGGLNWAPINTNLPSAGSLPIAIDPNNSSHLYAGTKLEGIFSTNNSGTSWSPNSDGLTILIRGMAFDTSNLDTLYAGSLGSGAFKSLDGGNSWKNIGLIEKKIFDVAVDPNQSQTVYAATESGVSRSINGGQTWDNLGQQTPYIFSMAVNSKNRETIYIGGSAGGLFKSTDGGKIWNPIHFGLPQRHIYALAFDPTDGTLFASPEKQGLYVSSNGGDTWSVVGGNSSLLEKSITNITIEPISGALYVTGAGTGILKSTDRGMSWHPCNNGLADLDIASISHDPTAAGTLYAAAYQKGVYKSIDNGVTWQNTSNGLLGEVVGAISVDKNNPGVLFAATLRGVFKSTDGAVSWQSSSVGLDITYNINNVLIDQNNSNTLYAVTSGSGIFKSIDAGLSWSAINSGLKNLNIPCVFQGISSEILYIGSLGSGFSKSTNSGMSWEGAIDSIMANPFILAIGIDPQEPSIIYAATGGLGVLKSFDYGVTWKQFNNGMDARFILCIVIDQDRPQTLYVGTAGGGVFVTDNGGQDWLPINDGLFHDIVTSLSIDKINNNIIYAGTEGGGVFKYVR